MEYTATASQVSFLAAMLSSTSPLAGNNWGDKPVREHISAHYSNPIASAFVHIWPFFVCVCRFFA